MVTKPQMDPVERERARDLLIEFIEDESVREQTGGWGFSPGRDVSFAPNAETMTCWYDLDADSFVCSMFTTDRNIVAYYKDGKTKITRSRKERDDLMYSRW